MTREIALHCMKSYSELHSDLCELCPIYGQTGSDHCFEDALQYVIGMLEQEPRKDEVILTNKEYRELIANEYDNGYCKGYSVALEEQEPILDKIRAEIEKEADASNRGYGISEIGLRKALKIIDKYKAESEE